MNFRASYVYVCMSFDCHDKCKVKAKHEFDGKLINDLNKVIFK